MTAPQAAAAEQQAAQAGLLIVVERALARAVPSLDVHAIDKTAPDLARLVHAIVARYGAAAATLAARFYQSQREAAGFGRFTVDPASPPGVQAAERMVGWATQPLYGPQPDVKAFTDRLDAGAGKLVTDVGRDTVIANVRRDRKAKGWARVPEPGACSFCALLATRGAVYREDTVGFKSHNHCRCVPEPVFTAYEPSAQIREWQALYQSIPHGSPAQMRLAFRQAFEGRTPTK